MSRFKVEQLCFDLSDSEKAAEFRANPDGILESYALSDGEKKAIKSRDIGELYKMGVLTQALWALSQVAGIDSATYVQTLRKAAGLPEIEEQLVILRKRRI